ncbi:hypothetical protein LP7551_03695 [Roseibium album]|nr:hypothetical protein LP7551_03695 [Roseibium album]
MERYGSCLCGEVTFAATAMPSIQACHCSMCRKWSGGPFMSVPCKEARFTGPVGRYASSEDVVRGFCSTCGSNLFYLANANGIYAIPIGLFADQAGLPFRAEIYIDEKPDYYAFANETKKLTGSEFEALFGGK